MSSPLANSRGKEGKEEKRKTMKTTKGCMPERSEKDKKTNKSQPAWLTSRSVNIVIINNAEQVEGRLS